MSCSKCCCSSSFARRWMLCSFICICRTLPATPPVERIADSYGEVGGMGFGFGGGFGEGGNGVGTGGGIGEGGIGSGDGAGTGSGGIGCGGNGSRSGEPV